MGPPPKAKVFSAVIVTGSRSAVRLPLADTRVRMICSASWPLVMTPIWLLAVMPRSMTLGPTAKRSAVPSARSGLWCSGNHPLRSAPACTAMP